MWKNYQTVDRLAPNLAHVFGLSGNRHQLIIFSHLTPKGGLWGVSGGQQFRNLGKVLNDWTDWHQIWHTSADSPGNGH